MRGSGLVLATRDYVGDTTPPLSLVDDSRFKNNGTFGATPPTWVRLPSGLWAYRFTRAPSASINCGADRSLEIQKHTIEYWMNISVMHAMGTESYPYQKSVWNTSGYFSIYDGWVYGHKIETPANRDVTVAALNNYVALGQWHKYSDVYDGTNLKIYIDGIERATNNIGAVTIAHDNAIVLTIGKTFFSCDAQITKYRMRRYARTPGAILADFEAEKHWYGR